MANVGTPLFDMPIAKAIPDAVKPERNNFARAFRAGEIADRPRAAGPRFGSDRSYGCE